MDSPFIMKSRLPLGDGYELDLSAYERNFPDFSQGSMESDHMEHMTARSTRFGSTKAQAQPSTFRAMSPELATPTRGPRFASGASGKQEPALPRFVKESSLPNFRKSEAPFLHNSKVIRYAPPATLSTNHQNPPASVTGKSEPQPTATLPELPNLTELVSGVYDNGTPVFSDYKKRHASRFASATQAGENTNQVSLPDVDQVQPKYDEKKLLASIRYLEDKVIELQHHQAEAQHTIQFLRQKAFECESKGRHASKRGDSALGSVDGASDGDDSEGGQRKRVIEKNRPESSTRQLESQINTMNDIVKTYKENMETLIKERDSAVSQLGVAYFTNEQLKRQNESLQEDNAELRRNVEELIANQEESTIEFEVNPNMTAKEVQFDRIMDEREHAANTRQRIKAKLRAHYERVTEAIPDLPFLAPQAADHSQKSRPASPIHGERKVTIDDVSLDVSYMSFVPRVITGVRDNMEDHRVGDDQLPNPVRQEETALSYSEHSTPSRREPEDSTGLGTPVDESTESFKLPDMPHHFAREVKQTSVHMDAGEQVAKGRTVRKVTPFPITRPEVRPYDPDMTSEWIVPDITIDFPDAQEPSVGQVSEVKADELSVEHSDNSHSTVERELRKTRPSLPSLLDDDRGSTVERRIDYSRTSQRSNSMSDAGNSAISRQTGKSQSAVQRNVSKPLLSLIDGEPLPDTGNSAISHQTGKSQFTFQRNIKPIPSLLDDYPMSDVGNSAISHQTEKSQSTIQRNFSKTRPSLLDDDSTSDSGNSAVSRRTGQSQLITDRSSNKTRRAQRSLHDEDSMSDAGNSAVSRQTGRSQLMVDRRSNKTRRAQRSLLDEDSMSDAGNSVVSRQTGKSQATLDRNTNGPRLTQRSLLDDESKPIIVASNSYHQTKKTKVIPRPIPVSERMPVASPYEEEPTMRPSQPPGIALATVLKALEDELVELKRSAKKYQQLYESHDPSLSRRSRKSVFDKIQTLFKNIDTKADHIYSLYDVLEGQKQQGQEMSQEEVEVTLQSIGINPEELSYASGVTQKYKRPAVHKDEPKPVPTRARSSLTKEWEGIESTGTQKTSSSRGNRRTL